jgi:predicted alpha/beta superfamily hydrolase
MLRIFLSMLIFAVTCISNAEETTEDKRIVAIDEPIVVANKFTFNSTILGNTRTFYVHLPMNYQTSTDSYPVLYTADGDRKILRVASVTHELSYFARRIPQMIVVGIANDGTRRANLSLLPSSMEFLKFITKELKPYIEKTYRTNDENLFLGSSAGGQLAVRALLEMPNEFDAYFAISPSLYHNDFNLVKKAKAIALSKQALNKTLYISIANEGKTMGVDDLASNLSKYPIKGLTWSFNKNEEETHGSISMRQLYANLQDYYSSWAPPHYKHTRDFEDKGGLAALTARYKSSDKANGVIPMRVLDDRAAAYMHSKQFNKGLELALLNISNHPNSSVARYYLAQYYVDDIKQPEKALPYYQQAIDVAIKNKNEKRTKRLHKIIEEYKLVQQKKYIPKS